MVCKDAQALVDRIRKPSSIVSIKENHIKLRKGKKKQNSK